MDRYLITGGTGSFGETMLRELLVSSDNEIVVLKYRKHKRYFSPSPAVTDELQGSI